MGQTTVQNVTVIDKSGQSSVLPVQIYESKFGYTAESAVSLWRFQPGYLEGCPVPVVMEVKVSFALQ